MYKKDVLSYCTVALANLNCCITFDNATNIFVQVTRAIVDGRNQKLFIFSFMQRIMFRWCNEHLLLALWILKWKDFVNNYSRIKKTHKRLIELISNAKLSNKSFITFLNTAFKVSFGKRTFLLNVLLEDCKPSRSFG